MPTYQYACTDCEHAFDQVQSFSEDSLSVCPACEGRLRKIFNSVGVVFKGSGFYRTDNRPEAKSSSETAGSDATSEAKSDTQKKESSGSEPSPSDSSKKDSSAGGSSRSGPDKAGPDKAGPSRSDTSRSKGSSGGTTTKTGSGPKTSDSPAA
ncbi:MAG: FmdB family transcriptional regulator [Nocardioidaceae bacterium]|nr:FmdB family transcriptional regulator [Nocardioidaceae bacterium]